MALFFLFMLDKEGENLLCNNVFDPVCFDGYVALIFGSCVLILYSADFVLQASFSSF